MHSHGGKLIPKLDHRDLALQSLLDYGKQLERTLRGLKHEEALWMPDSGSNHILWILWHMGRMEDMWGWYIRGGDSSAWIEGGWAKRLGIEPERTGVGDTIEQVRNFPQISVGEITTYWQAARNLLIPTVREISADSLENKHPEIWTHAPERAPTLLWVLGRIPVENSQHTGQIAYIRGMYASKFR
mgnify:FL=1